MHNHAKKNAKIKRKTSACKIKLPSSSSPSSSSVVASRSPLSRARLPKPGLRTYGEVRAEAGGPAKLGGVPD